VAHYSPPPPWSRPQSPHLTAAEEPWLQSTPPSSLPSPIDVSQPRFDWRLRSPPRAIAKQRDAQSDVTNSFHSTSYVRRILPALTEARPGDPFFDQIQAYQSQYAFFLTCCSVLNNTCSFLPLLASEQSKDEQVLKDRLASWPLDRLKEYGYTLTGLSAFWLEANQFGRPVASFAMGPGIVLPDHQFE
jgi:hypothetical protein